MLDKLIKVLRRDGVRWTLLRLVGRVLLLEMEIKETKKRILKKLIDEHGLTVAYGPFKGQRLSEDPSWDPYSRLPQILGSYEEHIIHLLKEFSGDRYSQFIDIGAADGFFAVGVVRSQIYSNSIAFEISEKGRETIKRCAKLNDVSTDVEVKGLADLESLQEAVSNKSSVVMIDIEGGEYDLLSGEVLAVLKECCVICELHPWLIPDGDQKQEKLINACENLFETRVIRRNSYDPNKIARLNCYSDEQRLLAMGEGRHRNMNWLVLTPKVE